MTTDDRPLCVVRIDCRSPALIVQSAASSAGELYGSSATGALWSADVGHVAYEGAALLPDDGAVVVVHVPATLARRFEPRIVSALRGCGLRVVVEGGA